MSIVLIAETNPLLPPCFLAITLNTPKGSLTMKSESLANRLAQIIHERFSCMSKNWSLDLLVCSFPPQQTRHSTTYSSPGLRISLPSTIVPQNPWLLQHPRGLFRRCCKHGRMREFCRRRRLFILRILKNNMYHPYLGSTEFVYVYEGGRRTRSTTERFVSSGRCGKSQSMWLSHSFEQGVLGQRVFRGDWSRSFELGFL